MQMRKMYGVKSVENKEITLRNTTRSAETSPQIQLLLHYCLEVLLINAYHRLKVSST